MFVAEARLVGGESESLFLRRVQTPEGVSVARDLVSTTLTVRPSKTTRSLLARLKTCVFLVSITVQSWWPHSKPDLLLIYAYGGAA